mmetsp:Transcript_34735/g.107464  ORF Transcript_34735/g.107464 Transcript_34735/m.107464 type:complete len:262 (+) Transcript_34735:76-861(+)
MVIPLSLISCRSIVPAEPRESLLSSADPSPAWAFPNVMPVFMTFERSIVAAEPDVIFDASVVAVPPPPAESLPNVTPVFSTSDRSILSDEPTVSFEVAARASWSCASVNSRLLAVASVTPSLGPSYVFLTAAPSEWMHWTTLPMSFPLNKSFVSKTSCSWTPSFRMPLKKKLMFSICLNGIFDVAIFLTEPGASSFKSLHRTTPECSHSSSVSSPISSPVTAWIQAMASSRCGAISSSLAFIAAFTEASSAMIAKHKVQLI